MELPTNIGRVNLLLGLLGQRSSLIIVKGIFFCESVSILQRSIIIRGQQRYVIGSRSPKVTCHSTRSTKVTGHPTRSPQ